MINLKPRPKKIILNHQHQQPYGHQRKDIIHPGNQTPLETLGVEKYYKTEERILDKKISKDGDNPANEKPNRFIKRPMPGLAKTSYDWVILDHNALNCLIEFGPIPKHVSLKIDKAKA